MPVTLNIAPVTISFSNTSQGDGLSYLWNFGDGESSQKENPSHTFNRGAWEVTLTVTNENGTDTSSTVIVAVEGDEDGNPKKKTKKKGKVKGKKKGGKSSFFSL